MSKQELMDDGAVTSAVAKLEGWERDGDAITRSFEFEDFVEAFGFLTRAAMLQEKADHHADVKSGYNQVTLKLLTHDAGGITQKDIDLAKQIDALVR